MNILLYDIEGKYVHLAFFFTHERKQFLNCYVIRHFKWLKSQKFDLLLLQAEAHFQKHFIDAEGHYDSASIFTSSFVDEYQSYGHILFKLLHGILPRNEIVSSFFYTFVLLLKKWHESWFTIVQNMPRFFLCLNNCLNN